MKHITSFQNPSIKNLLQLQSKSKQRRKQNVFVVEGQQEVDLCQSSGFEFVEVYFCPELYDEAKLKSVALKNAEVNSVSEKIYQKIAYRGGTEGVMAIVQAKKNAIAEVKFVRKSPLVLVVEAPEKPGNIGALLRTADASGVDAVLIADLKTDLYHPNTIRSSVGTVFTNQIGVGTSAEIIDFLQSNSIAIYAAILQEAKDYTTIDFTSASALVMGTESSGLTPQWRKASQQNMIIPMQGKVDSMNVSVATGVLLFEAVRQRNQHAK